MQGVNCGVCLCIGACGITAPGHKLPYKSLRGQPLFIVAAGQTVAVALIAIQKRKPHSLFLTG